MSAPNLVSRAVKRLRPTPAPTITHPLVAAYHDPDFVPQQQQDGVEVRRLAPGSRHGSQLSAEQREGIRAELAVRKQQAAQR